MKPVERSEILDYVTYGEQRDTERARVLVRGGSQASLDLCLRRGLGKGIVLAVRDRARRNGEAPAERVGGPEATALGRREEVHHGGPQ